MNDTLKIPVKTISGQPFTFMPTEMQVRVLGTDFNTGNNNVHFELRTSGDWDASRYNNRDFVDMGEVSIPNLALAAATANGQLNVALANQILAAFNLCVDEEKLVK
jgi:hypothetical protein